MSKTGNHVNFGDLLDSYNMAESSRCSHFSVLLRLFRVASFDPFVMTS